MSPAASVGLVIHGVRGITHDLHGVSGLARTVNVDATIDGARFEFACFAWGRWEVYDHPARWNGVPRFCGYLPATVGAHVQELATAWAARNLAPARRVG